MDVSDLGHQLLALGDAVRRENDDAGTRTDLSDLMARPEGALLLKAWWVIKAEVKAGNIR